MKHILRMRNLSACLLGLLLLLSAVLLPLSGPAAAFASEDGEEMAEQDTHGDGAGSGSPDTLPDTLPEDGEEGMEGTATVTVVNDALSLLSVPRLLFGEVRLSLLPITVQASVYGSATVAGHQGAEWSLSLRYAEEGDRLPGRLFFHENGVEKEITGDSQVIYRHSPEGGEEEAVFSKTWDGVEGAFCLEIYPEDVHGYAMDEEIAATLVWEIGYEVE